MLRTVSDEPTGAAPAALLSHPDDQTHVAPPLSGCVSVCVVACVTAATPHENVRAVADALAPVAAVRTVLLTEGSAQPDDSMDVVAVPAGTKLAKLCRFARDLDADLVCICDPDLAVDPDGCRAVFRRAAAEARAGRPVVAVGLIEVGHARGALGGVVAVDKWVSHQVLRRLLWAAGVGVTLPGQFLVVSAALLRALDDRVDSYLDDLYLGWLARRQGARVLRVPVVVGREESRRGWTSLLAQRVRWMRGLAALFGHLAWHPAAVALLAVHYAVYHALPVFALAGLVLLSVANPAAGAAVFVALVCLLAALSRQSALAAAGYLAVLPVVHLLATALWWVPVRRSVLTRR